jgi:hypothetical protein
MKTSQPRLIEFTEPEVDLGREALALRERASRKNTEAAYATAWATYVEFCKDASRGYRPLPAAPATVSAYLAYLHTVKRYAPRTIKQHKAAIRRYHHARGHVDPSKDQAVHDVWRGIIVAAAQAEPTLTYALWQRSVEAVVDAIDAQLQEQKKNNPFLGPEERLPPVRDRALVLLSASSALLTLHEIHALCVEEIVYGDRAIGLRVHRSPDAVAKPRLCTVRFGHDPRYCPVRALEEWIRVAELGDRGGPVFRPIDRHGHIGSSALSTRNIRAIVKRRCGLANIDERMISMRSLRQGAMQQRAYEGATVGELLEDAGLSAQSAANVGTLAAPARELRDRGRPAPDRLEIETSTF